MPDLIKICITHFPFVFSGLRRYGEMAKINMSKFVKKCVEILTVLRMKVGSILASVNGSEKSIEHGA